MTFFENPPKAQEENGEEDIRIAAEAETAFEAGDLDTTLYKLRAIRKSVLDKKVTPETPGNRLEWIDEERGVAFLGEVLARADYGPSSSDIFSVAEGLAGLVSESAWEMREKLMRTEVGNPKRMAESILVSLAGLDSKRAWAMGDEIWEKYFRPEAVPLQTIWGLDSEKAWDMRIKREANAALSNFANTDGKEAVLKEVVDSLMGIDTERAWLTRKSLQNDLGRRTMKDRKRMIMGGLAGIDSDEAWAVRDSFFSKDVFEYLGNKALEPRDIETILMSLIGIDTERAWKLRSKAIDALFKTDNHGDLYKVLGLAIAGLDSQRAWAIRDELSSIDNGNYEMAVARSLAGLDSERAWRIRDEMLAQGVYIEALSASISNPWLAAIIKPRMEALAQEEYPIPQ